MANPYWKSKNSASPDIRKWVVSKIVDDNKSIETYLTKDNI